MAVVFTVMSTTGSYITTAGMKWETLFHSCDTSHTSQLCVRHWSRSENSFEFTRVLPHIHTYDTLLQSTHQGHSNPLCYSSALAMLYFSFHLFLRQTLKCQVINYSTGKVHIIST